MKVFRSFLKPILISLIIAVIVGNIVSVLITYQDRYLSTTFWQTFPDLKQTYLNSQYVNKNPTGWIPDETVNTYAGAAYVQGVSPILIAPDTPPLGRYLIGWSALLFHNPNIIILFSVVGSLVVLYLIGMQIFKNSALALLAPMFVSFEPLFLNQLMFTPLLDIIQLFFLLLGFYFFNCALQTKDKKILFFILANITLGCFIATKFYASGITIIAAWTITLLILRRIKDVFILLATFPLAVIVLLLSYVRVLFDNYTLFSFLGIQKYVFLYHKSQINMPFSVWDLLFFNRWHVWFGNVPILSDAQWRISWPIITVLTLLTPFIWLAKQVKLSLPILSLVCWVAIYLAFLSVGESTVRYFVILIPVLYLVGVYLVHSLLMRYIPQIKKSL